MGDNPREGTPASHDTSSADSGSRRPHGEFRIVTAPPATADVVVVGGGIVGAASAFYLARAGLHPVLIESGPDLGNLTTSSSAHSVRAQFSEPENIAMMLESIAVYSRFADYLGLPPDEVNIDFTQQGYLFATTVEDALTSLRDRVTHQRQLGLPDVEFVDGDDARRRFPYLAPNVLGATYRPTDGWLNSVNATVAFARASGATVLLNSEVRTIHRNGGRVTGVETDFGPIATDTVVLAAGPFFQTLAGEPLPIQLLRRHRLIVAPHPKIPQGGPMTVDADTGAHWRPHHGGALLAWPRPEAPGPPLSPVPPDPTFPDMILRDSDGVGRISPFWRDLAPDLEPDQLDLVAGQYDNTPDHKPLIGPARATDGLWFHIGYSGHGVMGGPSGARLLADLITGMVGPEGNPFRPHRFDNEPVTAAPERMVL